VSHLPEPEFVKSTFSNNGGNCVEVAVNQLPHTGHVLLRDSKNPGGAVHAFTEPEWKAFLAGVRAGEFDINNA
jgi:hypothetical protein